ncbi:MAG: efflux RND transporter periplasmic adaptor subunit [Candidatus Marinimicrobia bacterium]|nr:efflux RND transporter periplasmic adaptor subunit [Candidatus Neomarinimicrobiota bacterium]
MKKTLALSFTFLLLLSACSKNESNKTVENRPPLVKVETTRLRKHQPLEIHSGTIVARREANLASILPGRVEKFHVSEGEEVEEGQLIAELSGELLTTAQIEYESYKKDFGRVKRLFEKGSVPEQQYDHVKAQYEAKEAQYNLVKKNTEIRAPFAGTITQKMIEEGETFMLLNPGLDAGYSHASGVVRLMDLKTLEVKISVNEKEISRYQIGLPAMVVSDAYPDSRYPGQITKIDDTFDVLTKTAQVTVEIKNQEKALKPGMYARVEIPMAERENIFVPLGAIYREAATGRDYVFTIENQKVKRNTIKRLYTDRDFVAVSGLTAGQTLVVEGKSRIKDGTKVQIFGQ